MVAQRVGRAAKTRQPRTGCQADSFSVGQPLGVYSHDNSRSRTATRRRQDSQFQEHLYTLKVGDVTLALVWPEESLATRWTWQSCTRARRASWAWDFPRSTCWRLWKRMGLERQRGPIWGSIPLWLESRDEPTRWRAMFSSQLTPYGLWKKDRSVHYSIILCCQSEIDDTRDSPQQ